MVITRGFKGKERNRSAARDRVPPGQYLTPDFPVLSAGPTPRTSLEEWSFALKEGGRTLAEWRWTDFEMLPQTEMKVDIHCVTKWSKLDTRWLGVTFDDLLGAAELDAPRTSFVMAHCDGGYMTNVPVADLLEGRAMIATHYEGVPILPAHGGPARLLVPHLYFWKSAKWVRSLDFIDHDQRGFWESLGYHNYGDPWREQRYEGDP
jgi:DMSO/TMAO reductase YedYZ molybdopterin-dependent catalytic subunit